MSYNPIKTYTKVVTLDSDVDNSVATSTIPINGLTKQIIFVVPNLDSTTTSTTTGA